MPKDTVAAADASPMPGGTTPSEEMYLITVAMAEEGGREGPLPLASLAQALSISPVSANQMVWRLADRGLVDYHPYRGVLLSPAGRTAARRVLRGRRLWTSFLVEHLGFGEEEADALACDLEHLTPPRVADRLGRFLGEPMVVPLGRPIPPAAGEGAGSGGTPLAAVPLGRSAVVLEVGGDAAVGAFLDLEGIRPGCRVTVEARGAGGAVLVAGPAGRCHLQGPVASVVMVRPCPEEGGHRA